MDSSTVVQVTYYLDVISSWCWWTEPTWADLQRRFEGRIQFDWRIALVQGEGFPASREQLEWFYRRSGMLTRSPYRLNAGWLEPGRLEYLVPNLVAEAARDLGITDDRARLAVAAAAVRDGSEVSRWDVSVSAAAAATGLDAEALRDRAQSPEVEARIRASTSEFHSLRISQRPAFVVENGIGDRAVLSGLTVLEPLVSIAEAMLADAAGYASFAAQFGGPPEV
jgi:predicted DsbA family dithiol-disulfide isomerase